MSRERAAGGRDFLLLLSGQAVSTLGSQACALAFPLITLATTGSPALAGLLGFVAGLPALALQLPAGLLVDRWDRRRVMLACDVGRLGLVLAVVVAGSTGSLGFGQLVVTAAVHAALSVAFNLAHAAALPNLLDPAELPAGIARQQSAAQATILGGRPLGGWLFGLAPVLPFAVNAVSYVVSLATLCGVRADLRPRSPEGGAERGRRRWRREIGEGLAFVWAQPVLRALALLNAVATLLAGGFTLVVVVLLTDLGASPARIGLLFGACGAAGLVGAALTPRLLRRVASGRVYVVALAISALAAAAMSATSAPWQAGVLAAVIVGLGPPAAVVLQVARARTIPRHLFARVRAVENTIATSTAPLASLLAGLALSVIGAAATCAVIGGGLLVVALAALALPAVRRMTDGRDVVPPAGSAAALDAAPSRVLDARARGRHRRPAGAARAVHRGAAGRRPASHRVRAQHSPLHG